MDRDWREVVSAPRDRALCAHAEKLTRDPHAVTLSDLNALRQVGLTDRALLDLSR